MSGFRNVDGAHAGPSALGILVPPGRRTMLLLRPRALGYDLVALRDPSANGPGPAFQELSRHEAEVLARRLYATLSAEGGLVRIETVRAGGTDGSWVQARVGEVTFVVCRRVAGQPYQPLVFATAAEADRTTAALAETLCPNASASQELYLNLRHFGR